MRIARLDLLRYGKFKDRSIELPAAERDIHILMGANEAGKSTLRNAITDLLYGIEHNTRYGYLHGMPEMRLGARLEQGTAPLELVRRKGHKQTLHSPAGGPLADAVLLPYLGAGDRQFFERMFGLDHTRLVKGGAELLSASDDLGQLLFRSAAGLAGLGDLAQRLENEADSLWGPRKRGDRAYHVAAEALDAAEAELKATTVKARDWAAAQAEHQDAVSAHDEAKARHAALRVRKQLLERVRRTRPGLEALQLAQGAAQALAAAAAVTALPADARQTLNQAQTTAALCAVEIEQHRHTLQGIDEALRRVQPDPALLAAAADIDDLHRRGLLCAGHPAAILAAQGLIDGDWARARDLARQLGWPDEGEDALRQRLPALALRTRLGTLVAQHATLELALRNAADQQHSKQREVESLQAQLDALSSEQAPAGLARALAQAQRLGEVDARSRVLQQALAGAEQARTRALAALRLGEQTFTDDAALQTLQTLLTLQLPADTLAQRHLADEQADAADDRATASALAELQAQLAQLELDITQYRAAHRTVEVDELHGARQRRDGLWQQLVLAPATLPQRAGSFEALVLDADQLADLRHATAHEASTLQEKRHRMQELQQRLARLQARQLELQQARAGREQAWAARMVMAGVPGLGPEGLAGWRLLCAAALQAAAALSAAQQALADHQAAVDGVRQALLHALPASAADNRLAPLIDHAEGLQRRADAAEGSRRLLGSQRDAGRLALLPLQQALHSAGEARDAWQQRWALALADARLDPQAPVDAIGGTLATFAQIDAALQAMQAARSERIAGRQAELDTLATLAQALAARLAPDLAEQAPAAVAVALVDRLGQARTAAAEQQRRQAERAQVQVRLDAALARQQLARAGLRPLLLQAGLGAAGDGDDDHAALAAAIDRSDRWRQLQADQAAASQALLAAGDGLTLAELLAEAQAVEPSQLLAELDAIGSEEAGLVEATSTLAVRREHALQALDAMGGSASAAVAEGRRQQALAAMTDAVERYVELATAARLLRWALERYRESQQGPMLAAASRGFERLTGGAFDRLVVDFEHDPPILEGRRRDGSRVGVAALSDGTRDQLFLALRLAALELHLEQGHALPFIADDLFVNFDDTRSLAGFQALGELSRRTQVIYLTHHRHLAEVAQQALGDAARVLEL